MLHSKSELAVLANGFYGPASQALASTRSSRSSAQGLRNSEVAEVIGTTENVAKNHLRIIFDKLGFWNRVERALWYEARRQAGLAYEEPDRMLAQNFTSRPTYWSR